MEIRACFMYSWVYPGALLALIWEVVFWTLTNCDHHKLRQIRNLCRQYLWFVAICDQGRAGTNRVQLHWQRVLSTWESTHVHIWHEYGKLHFYPLRCYIIRASLCVYISYNGHKRCTKETFLNLSDVYVNVFSALGSILSGMIDINLRSCVLNRHKLRQSQTATNQEFLPSYDLNIVTADFELVGRNTRDVLGVCLGCQRFDFVIQYFQIVLFRSGEFSGKCDLGQIDFTVVENSLGFIDNFAQGNVFGTGG